LITCIALATPALAQPRKIATLAVALDRRLEVEAAMAGVALRRTLQNDARFEAVDLTAAALGEGRAPQARKAHALVAEALQLLDEMKEKRAAHKASEALAACEAADLTSAFPDLLDALAARALAYSAIRDRGDAKAELSRLFALKPDYKLDPRRLPPDLAQRSEEARLKVSRAPRVALEVRSAPVPAEVFVDGTYRGIAPLEVRGLAPGDHYLTLRAPGYDLAQERRPAGLGTPVELSLVPAPAENGLLALIRTIKSSLPPGSEGGGASLARWAGADEVLVVGLQKKGEATWAVATRFAPDGRMLASLEEALPTPEGIEALAHEVLLMAPAKPVAVATPHPSETPASAVTEVAATRTTSNTRRALGFTAGGVGVAALGGGIAMGLSASAKAKDARATPQLDQDLYRSRRDSARKLAIGADVLYGVAALGAAAGTWLLFTGNSRPVSAPASATTESGEKSPGTAIGFLIAPLPGGAAVSVSGGF
jgi:hypothetical protein